jgi:hypothetical protein
VFYERRGKKVEEEQRWKLQVNSQPPFMLCVQPFYVGSLKREAFKFEGFVKFTALEK